MTEKEKMLCGQNYNTRGPELFGYKGKGVLAFGNSCKVIKEL